MGIASIRITPVNLSMIFCTYKDKKLRDPYLLHETDTMIYIFIYIISKYSSINTIIPMLQKEGKLVKNKRYLSLSRS